MCLALFVTHKGLYDTNYEPFDPIARVVFVWKGISAI